MTDFLEFLNTADTQTLTKIPGVTRAIAENIVAARPFDFVEDCAKVNGVGKNLLGKMQTFFEAELNESRNSAMIPVEQEAMTAPPETGQPAQESNEEKPSFLTRLGRALGNFLRALLRLVVIILVIGGIGAGLYYGLPYLNKTFIAPVERNTARVNELEDDVAVLQTQLNEVNARMDTIETSVALHTASLEKLEEIQAALESALGQKNDEFLLELKHEVMTTRALDMLGRARLYLAQSNFGLAKEDVQAARDLLAVLQTETNDDFLAQVVDRLDLALGNLPAFPVVASGDLEIAWQLLMTGMPVNTVTATPSPAPFPTFTPTPSLLLTATSTPEPPPEVSSTATP